MARDLFTKHAESEIIFPEKNRKWLTMKAG
jgi:hypothetical protein